jgi:alanyl-tRNA synthetase
MRILKYRKEDNRVQIVYDRTPFYAEAGGQVGDTGYIEAEGIRIRIDDVKRMGDLLIHMGVLVEGALEEKADRLSFKGHVDVERRRRIMANHTATHLLHHALRKVIGAHATQAGSLVAPDRLRFDFNHYNPLSSEQIEIIEEIVNRSICANIPVIAYDDVPMEKAREMGAVALFGEKYGEKVRVIRIDDLSSELCGGTHAERTGDIGLFKIVREGSISSGVRRIEAVTGLESLEYMRNGERILREASEILRSNREGLVENLMKLAERTADLDQRLQKEKKKDIQGMFDLEKQEVRAGRFSLIHIEHPELSTRELREVSDSARSRMKMGVIFITSRKGNRLSCLLSVTDDAVQQGLKAGDLLRGIAPLFGGKGGGRSHLAQGGGTNPGGAAGAFKKLIEIVKGL